MFSTAHGRVCPRCGWPVARCSCARAGEQAVPDRIVARLRLSTAGRRGKAVTVVEGLPRSSTFLKDLGTELRRACGAGGTIAEDRVELQGDHREKLRALLTARGWTVKG